MTGCKLIDYVIPNSSTTIACERECAGMGGRTDDWPRSVRSEKWKAVTTGEQQFSAGNKTCTSKTVEWFDESDDVEKSVSLRRPIPTLVISVPTDRRSVWPSTTAPLARR
uniref:Uncharacterized protein n=1 Tax=Plectus sambesii TaxID=2011161 RepID=A0A914X0F7_9BILA